MTRATSPAAGCRVPQRPRDRGPVTFVESPVEREQQAGARAEVVVGDRPAHPGLLREGDQRQTIGALSAHDRQGGAEQLLPPGRLGQTGRCGGHGSPLRSPSNLSYKT